MNALLEAALSYAARGWHVFPCAPEAKHPITERGYKDATTDKDRIAAWWTANPNANIGLNLEASGLVAIDADTYKPDCGWSAFAANHDLPPTLTQRSARGGTHFIFRSEPGTRYRTDLGPSTDMKHKGYVLLSPSVFSGGVYQWQNDAPIAPAPEWLKRPEKTLAETVGNATGTTGRTLAEVEDALRWVNPDVPYEPWMNVLMAIHDEFGADGITLADEWSARAPHRYKDGMVEAKFASFSSGGGVTISTVFDLARKAGADLGQLRAKHFDVSEFFQPAGAADGGGRNDHLRHRGAARARGKPRAGHAADPGGPPHAGRPGRPATAGMAVWVEDTAEIHDVLRVPRRRRQDGLHDRDDAVMRGEHDSAARRPTRGAAIERLDV